MENPSSTPPGAAPTSRHTPAIPAPISTQLRSHPCGDAVLPHQANHGVFQPFDVRPRAQSSATQGDDGVRDKLARAVERRLAAARCHAHVRMRGVGRGQEVTRAAALAYCVHRGMLWIRTEDNGKHQSDPALRVLHHMATGAQHGRVCRYARVASSKRSIDESGYSHP